MTDTIELLLAVSGGAIVGIAIARFIAWWNRFPDDENDGWC